MFLNQSSQVTTFLLFVSVIVLPQSYFVIKAVILAAFLFVHAVWLSIKSESFISVRDLVFYFLLCMIAIVWSIVGMLRGAPTEAILANMKLYFGWSILYFVILTIVRNSGGFDFLHRAVVWSVLVIAGLNLFALANVVLNLGVVDDSLRRELGLSVELHGGYVRFGANSIASLFFLVGYLIAFKCFNSSRDRAGTIALLVGLAVVILSGRRALWLAICMVPFLVYAVAVFSGSLKHMTAAGRVLMGAYVLGVGVAVLIFVMLSSMSDLQFLEYLQSAFSEQDERTIQSRYLIDSFKEHPLIGSGYGGYAGYTRSAATPWLYELTYHQLAFNLGIVGATVVLSGFAYYMHFALNQVRHSGTRLPVSIGLLVGFLTILIGSYSNPYLQFFDSMVFIMFFVGLSGSAGPRIYMRRCRDAQAAVIP